MPTPEQLLQAEQHVIGALLLDNLTYFRVPDLEPHHFTDTRHQRLFSTIRDLITRDQPADFFSAQGTEKLDYLVELTRNTPSTANIHVYADVVRNCARRRHIEATLKNALATIDEYEPDDLVSQCVTGLQQHTHVSADCTLGNAMDAALRKAEITQERRRRGTISGIDTTLPRLNKFTGGLQGPKMVTIGGRPSTYKTAFAFQVAVNAAKHGKPVGIVSLEMGADELGERALANLLRIDGYGLSVGEPQPYLDARARLDDQLRSLPLWIDDTAQTWGKIEARIVEWKYRHDIELAVIDYIQIIHTSGNRFEALSEISRRTKLLAKRLNMPVLILSQLSREMERENRRPMLSDLRECGNIEQDSDIVLFMHRIIGKDQEQDQYELILAKQRGGPARRKIPLEIVGPNYFIGEGVACD